MSKVDIVSRKRLEEITINAIEWAIEVGEQTTYDLILGMGITSDELDAIGYDKENFGSLHDAVDKIRFLPERRK